MTNLGCFSNWEEVPLTAEDGEYFNYIGDTDEEHKNGIYYWNVRLVDSYGENNPDWTYLNIFPSKPHREDMMMEMLGASTVNEIGEAGYEAIIQTTDKELDYWFNKALMEIVSYLDKKRPDELPTNCEDIIYSSQISWAGGLLHNLKNRDYILAKYAQSTIRYKTPGDYMIDRAMRLLRPISKNRDINDTNRKVATGRIRKR